MILRRLFGSRTAADEAEPSTVTEYETADEGDRLILDQLRSIGADLSQPREVLHYLYLPTREAADAVGADVEPRGYAVEIRPAAGPPGPNPWLCLATIVSVVSLESVRAAREEFEVLAGAHGGEYDGWEAAGTP